MNRKIKIMLIATPLSLALIAGGVMYAMPDKHSSNIVEAKSNTPVASAQTAATVVAAESETNISPEPTPAPKPSAAPTPTPTAPQTPMYGEMPDHPGIYRVFDKNAVMEAAGVAVADRAAATTILGGWTYRNESTEFGLCGQAVKANLFGDDWKTNPITQMKFCDYYAKHRYGSWSVALEQFQATHGW